MAAIFVKKSLDYSPKNMPIPGKDSYLKALIDKTENLIRRMRWKVFFFEKDMNESEDCTQTVSNHFGFKSDNNPPAHKELTQFENDLFNVISNIKFSNRRSEFQKKVSYRH